MWWIVAVGACFIVLFGLVFIGLGPITPSSEKTDPESKPVQKPTVLSRKTDPESKPVQKPTVLSRSEAEHAVSSGKCPDCGRGALNGTGSGYSATIVASCDNPRCGHSFYLPTDLLLRPSHHMS
jgi:hypothetical protein